MSELLNINQQTIATSELSLGHSVLMANNLEGGRPVLTANFVSPDHELPLPWPEGDWYLRQSFVPAVSPGETVICHTLIGGLLEYYHDIGLIPPDAEIIQVEPKTPISGYGFPATDALEVLRGEVEFSADDLKVLCSTFGGSKVNEQARDLNLQTIARAASNLSNHKARLRQAAAEHEFTMLPGINVNDWEDLEPATLADWNTEHGTWLKFPTGSGGDLVIKVDGVATDEALRESVAKLRETVRKAFQEAQFTVDFEDFWPSEALAPAGHPLVLEADARYLGAP